MTTTSHPIFARLYERYSAAVERSGYAEHRRDLLAGLHGRVIEVGAGNGLNFAHYPGTVTEVIAVEPEPRLRATAQKAASSASVPITVLDGSAEALPADDNTFDVAVASLVLCTVPDQATALSEIHRVLRPGGRLRFLEHVAARHGRRLLRIQRLTDATLGPRLMGGCHTSRDTATAIAAAGFRIEKMDRFRFPATGLATPYAPHIRGTALRERNR
ncbi:class I SAM-dependent methyltransferase [Cryptosporangium aurantiacum]|uniref:Methyltransferase domain-containing protein n=1 Tax=Cryptosporangium aurantiacum TaxID=134849 RepID=A0A1M7PAZ4_9ACTN|nr:class I SAM-dependent methyltransferase [Cryptosporangium aurantiacum]SHN13944.1 Methyltransferase domain-containing protein [Cryptosporangium aurantiacum]